MLRETLFRVGGWAAIIAGVLRAAGSFTSSLGSDVERQSLYFIIDLFLLIAVFTVYAQNHAVVGPWGAAGFLTTVAGILLVRSSRAVPGLDLYPAGALGIAGGWAVLALASWYKGRGSVFVPVLFTLSIVTAIAGQLAAAAPAAFVASGVIFSAAVVSVGLQVLKA
jgi:hypothetical protein